MRPLKDENIERVKSHATGFAAAFGSFVIIWPADVTSTRLRFYPKAIFEGGIKQSTWNYLDAISPNHRYQGVKPLCKSFVNQGFYWGFLYTLLAGSITFPAQKEIKNLLDDKKVANNLCCDRTLHAFAGWSAGLMQLITIHPVDSMKVISQQYPEITNKRTLKYFYNEQPRLRRGTGVVALGSISHFFAWNMKVAMKDWLQENRYDPKITNIIGAFTFSLTHIAIAFPFNTIKTWVQGDIDYSPRHDLFKNKIKRTVNLTADNVKKLGFSSLYRGIFSRGLMHTTAFALNMSIYDCVRKNQKISP